MKAFVLLLLLLSMSVPAWAREFKLALPGYSFRFPMDHASHNQYKTEWWYYTGHLDGEDGTKYGYELTFFRSGTDVPRPIQRSPWSVDDIYLAHFAVTDLNAQRFFYTERLNRSGVGFAGADQKNYYVWNSNWRAAITHSEQHKLVAADGDYKIDLTLTSEKPPVLHGNNGHSQKASCTGCASYYYSLTRMRAEGTLTRGGKPIKVSGITWMDHEFGSNQLTAEQVGWDWFSLQLNDGTELMLYVMRRRDGTLDENSSGTYVMADGSARHLALKDYAVKSTGTWKSSVSKATYPMGWHVEIPALGASFDIKPQMENQELARRSDTDVTYWEGTCTVSGNIEGRPIVGQAYVEMTGYAEQFSKRI